MPPKGYIHGYSALEQDRLYQQARFLEDSLYENIDFSKAGKILEIGTGVGAQTEILLERFPHLKIQGIEWSKTQILRAKKHLSKSIREGRVTIDQGDAHRLPYTPNSFDGAFASWFLEHVKDPVQVLKEVRKVLRAAGTIYCTEPMNATFFVHPYSPATLKYWFEVNDLQWTLGGDPFVGGKLANYLMAAGFQNIKTSVKVDHFDNRAPKKRADHIEYWTSLLLSGAADLLKAKRVTKKDIAQMKTELAHLKEDPNAVFFICWVQASAQAF
ncbi:MAG: methyltransferase domain-containing protein [Bdellovibrionota bacterium]